MKYPELLERFISYCKIDTQSSFESNTYPSTESQKSFMLKLKEELIQMGLSDVNLSKMYYLTARIDGTKPDIKPIALIAHIDTSPEESGANIVPRIIYDYDGSEIHFPDDKDLVLSDKIFPELSTKKGKTLITASGKTLLGADDKAGVAEIITAASYIKNNPAISHPDIYLLFTPDEEVGNGTEYFERDSLPAEYGYTLDGGGFGIIEAENFNAINGTISIKGFNTHPGNAKNKMVNAVRVASFLISKLDLLKSPERTEKMQGFIHPNSVIGDVSEAKITLIVRDFILENAQKMVLEVEEILKEIEKDYPGFHYETKWNQAYLNMKKIIDENPEVLDRLIKACNRIGIQPKLEAIRGGTDGARLSFMGLPCPNIWTGGYLYHSRYEFAVLEEMEKTVDLLISLISE